MKDINRNVVFWSFQSSYWFVYYIFLAEFLYGKNPLEHYLVSIYCFCVALIGILFSLLLKYLYDSKLVTSISRLNLILVVLVSSIVLSNIWIIEIWFLDYIYSNYLNVATEIEYIREVIMGTIVLSIWSFLYLLINSWYELSQQEMKAEKAQLLAKTSQLNSLRYQLNPHFLFNALNSVRALIYKSPENADVMISKLSEFMRYSLIHKDELELPFEDEISVIKNYLDIEKIRFGGKLKVETKVDPIANEYPIPPFLIIPLVENAVKYGMKTSLLPLCIKISAEVMDNEITISVCNTGKWYKNDNEKVQGSSTNTGIKNIQLRLENIYPSNHSFEIIKKDSEVIVVIKINKEVVHIGD